MILLRHGQTVFNVHFGKNRIDPGEPDPRLTDVGKRQAIEAADQIRDAFSIRRIVASPYMRAIETAEIVQRRLKADIEVDIEIDADIRERAGYSCDIGSSPGDLVETWPGLNFSSLSERWWAYPDGDPAMKGLDEPEAALNARVDRFRQRVADHPDWAETLVVCHWGPIRSLIGERIENGRFVQHDPRR